jgi:hypothetical protein
MVSDSAHHSDDKNMEVDEECSIDRIVGGTAPHPTVLNNESTTSTLAFSDNALLLNIGEEYAPNFEGYDYDLLESQHRLAS